MAILRTETYPGEPNLAVPAPPLDQLRYPLAATGKVDGVRGLFRNDRVFSRKLKPFPNKHVNEMVASAARSGFNLDGLDGEWITDTNGNIDPCAQNHLCNRTSSAMTTRSGAPILACFLFDIQPDGVRLPLDTPYRARRQYLVEMKAAGDLPEWMHLVPFAICRGPEQVLNMNRRLVDEGGMEGLVLQSLTAPYKFGRSTAREGSYMRYTAWASSEAEIIGWTEAMENMNTSVVLDTGMKQKQTSKATSRPMGRVGSWQVRDLKTGVEFYIGTGFTHDMAKAWFDTGPDSMKGQFISYRFKPAGVKVAPRFPSFRAIRSPIDM